LVPWCFLTIGRAPQPRFVETQFLLGYKKLAS
jgi:hypothetical protein